MKNSEIIQTVMFDFEGMTKEEITELCKPLKPKMLRWLFRHHQDNWVRKIFARMTNVEIGEDTVICHNIFISDDYEPLLKIGKRTCIGWNISFICNTGFNNNIMQNNEYIKNHVIKKDKIIIEDDTWIGEHSIILAGITIGKGSIVAPGSVVTKNVAPYTVVAGVPAKEIKKIEKNKSAENR